MRQSLATKIAAAAATVLAAVTVGCVIWTFAASSAADAAVQRQGESLDAAQAATDSSAFLTSTVRSFTVTGDRASLDAYWKEVTVDQTQAKALARLKTLGTPEDEIALVNKSHDLSYNLVNQETRTPRWRPPPNATSPVTWCSAPRIRKRRPRSKPRSRSSMTC